MIDQKQSCSSTDAGAELAASYRRTLRRRVLLLAALILLCAACFIAELAIGGGTLSLCSVLRGLLHPAQVDPTVRVILWQLRLPVALTAVLAGAGLAIAGNLMQGALNNPLAEPFTLGLSSAAGFGAALVIVLEPWFSPALGTLPQGLLVSASAFLFSVAVIAGLALFAQARQLRPETIVLLGIAVHFTFSSLLAFTQYLADADQLQTLVFWLLGSVQRASWTQVAICGALLACILPLLLVRAWALTAVGSFGAQASVLGLRVARVRLLMLLAAALLASAVTATVGIVGFVGLVAPHIARMLVGEDQRFALATSATCGGVMMLTAALASQTLVPGAVLPVGMLTALLGVPVFLWLILRQQATYA
jgi:iron complex transport system permease protein